MKKILCLSGGGVRGIAQIECLKAFEQQNNNYLYNEYDLIIGTSVGAVNAAIVASGKVSMYVLSLLYENMLKGIFKKRLFPIFPKYDRKNFTTEWQHLIGPLKFRDVKTKLIITTMDLVSTENIFYKSWKDDYANYDIHDLLIRSFAAPIYFGHIHDPERGMVYSDAGIGLDSFPINEAKLQAEMFSWYEDGEEVEIHAVGTLFSPNTNTYKQISNKRTFGQLLQYLNLPEGGMARYQTRVDQLRMMEYICSRKPSIKFKYWDYPTDYNKMQLDGIKHISYYRELGREMAKAPLISYN